MLDIANDPMWLLLRLETFAGGSVPPNIAPPQRDARLAQLDVGLRRSHRAVRGRARSAADRRRVRAAVCSHPSLTACPGDVSPARHDAARRARLRWLYGLVGDRYPLEIRQPTDRRRSNGSTARTGAARSICRVSSRGRRGWRSSRQYLSLGYTHILPKGLDHILFVLGLFLLSPRAQDRSCCRSRRSRSRTRSRSACRCTASSRCRRASSSR